MKNKKMAVKWLVALIWLCIWQFFYLVVNQEILLVSPFDVLKTILKLAVKYDFWRAVFYSLFRIMLGYLVGVLMGTVIGFFTSISRFLYDLVIPAVQVMKATPVASFIILALLWMRAGTVPGFISFLMVFPIVWTNIMTGIQNTDKKLLEMAFVYDFDIIKKMKFIYIPSLIPYFTASCTIGMGMAWKAGIAAEVISNPKYSIGRHLYQSKIYLETAELFAWTVIVILLSVLFEKCFILFMKKIELKYFISPEEKNHDTVFKSI